MCVWQNGLYILVKIWGSLKVYTKGVQIIRPRNSVGISKLHTHNLFIVKRNDSNYKRGISNLLLCEDFFLFSSRLNKRARGERVESCGPSLFTFYFWPSAFWHCSKGDNMLHLGSHTLSPARILSFTFRREGSGMYPFGSNLFVEGWNRKDIWDNDAVLGVSLCQDFAFKVCWF